MAKYDSDVLMTVIILKVALIAFIVGGTAALIIRGVRRSRANRLDPRWNAHRSPPGYEASVMGVMPNTPLPEWVNWDDEEADDHRKDGPP